MTFSVFLSSDWSSCFVHYIILAPYLTNDTARLFIDTMFLSFSSDSKVSFIFQQYSFDINSFISSCLIPSTFKTQNNCFLFPLPYISSLHHSASNVCSVCTTSPLLIISNAHFDKSNSIFISGEKTLTICTKLSSCSSFLAMIFRLFMIKR